MQGGLQHKNVVHPALRDPGEAGCVAPCLSATTWGFKSPLRHHHHVSSHHRCRSGDLNRRGALTNRKKRATHGSPSAPSRAAMAVALDGRPHSRTMSAPWGTPQRITRGARLRRANPPFGTSKHKGLRDFGPQPFFFLYSDVPLFLPLWAWAIARLRCSSSSPVSLSFFSVQETFL